MSVLFLFQSTRDVIRAEKLSRSDSLVCQVVPVPRNLSAECGMSLSVAELDAERLQTLLDGAGIRAVIHHPAEREKPAFDLLSTVEYGGCSAKLPADLLAAALKGLPEAADPALMVGLDTCDDAAVYRLTDEIALIETTDFFPPVCSDAYEFGQIAAANAVSDVFAMGGRVLTAMNLVMFPSQGIPFEVLYEILRGGQEKVSEAGGLVVGGHTIADSPPKYGLAVTGIVHPQRVITNANARPGEALILTKPIGTGAVVAGHRIGQARRGDYQKALETMKQLNRTGAEVMQQHSVRCATDITGFGLLGHAMHIARASRVTLEIDTHRIPLLPGARELVDMGCIPGAAFRNLAYVESYCGFDPGLSYTFKMLALDPQTSGGLLMTVPSAEADSIVSTLRQNGYAEAAIIGVTGPSSDRLLLVR